MSGVTGSTLLGRLDLHKELRQTPVAPKADGQYATYAPFLRRMPNLYVIFLVYYLLTNLVLHNVVKNAINIMFQQIIKAMFTTLSFTLLNHIKSK